MQWNSPAEAQRFVSDYANPILRLCTTYSLTREDAQDICQEIFLKLLEQQKEFTDREHEKAYILKIDGDDRRAGTRCIFLPPGAAVGVREKLCT